MSFVDMIVLNALAAPERPAIILPDRVVTYGMVGKGIRSVEERAVSAGLKKGNVVAILIESPTKHLIMVCGLFRLGIVTVSVRREQELHNTGIVVDAMLVTALPSSSDGKRRILADDTWFDHRQDSPSLPSATNFSEGEICRIALSSGTTGIPKPIGFTPAALDHAINTCYPVMNLAPWDRILCLPGLATHFGFGVAMFALHAGRTLLFANSAKESLQIIALYGVNYLVASPQHVIKLLEVRSETPFPCASLRVLHMAGSLPTKALIFEAQAKLCNNVMCVYGSTEAWIMAFAPTDALRGIEGAVGLIAPWARLEIVGKDGAVLGPDEEGRVRVLSPSQGYPYRGGEAVSSPDEWFYPGDIGKIVANGLLVLTGRSSDVINIGGVKFAPELVEEVLLTHEKVKDAAALGVVGKSGNEELWVAIVGTADPQDIKAYCANNRRDFTPDRVFTVDAIPHNEAGKIARAVLRDELVAKTK